MEFQTDTQCWDYQKCFKFSLKCCSSPLLIQYNYISFLSQLVTPGVRNTQADWSTMRNELFCTQFYQPQGLLVPDVFFLRGASYHLVSIYGVAQSRKDLGSRARVNKCAFYRYRTLSIGAFCSNVMTSWAKD